MNIAAIKFSAISFILLIVQTIVLLSAQTVFAQSANSLNLHITDQNGALITRITAKLKDGKKVAAEANGEETGELFFPKLRQGIYILEIEARGFAVWTQEIEIKSGRNELDAILEVETIIENVEIAVGAQEKSVENAFSGFFTREQIDALPDDPAEIERELKRRYGEDTIIRVDGFTGRIPKKSQIASIKASLSSFDAENHELGFTYVDIITKVSDEKFSGDLSFTFNDSALNARPPFSQIRLPEQTGDVDFFLLGPLLKNRASFWLWLGHNSKIKTENITAFLPTGLVGESVAGQTKNDSLDTNINQNLPYKHVGKLVYSFWNKKSANAGVGGFNLPERAFTAESRQHQLQFSESGYIGKRFLNTLQIEFARRSSVILPQNENPTIIVLDAFSRGSAGNAAQNESRTFRLADNLLFGIQKHALKIGGLLQIEKRSDLSGRNRNGTFLFSSLGDFQANKPALFTQSGGFRKSNVLQTELGIYIQDDIRLRKSFSLSIGLRYELQNNLRDFNNFSPRIGFTWSPHKSGKTTFRGGVGIFYNWLESDSLSFINGQSFDQPGDIVITNPDFPNPFINAAHRVLPKTYWKKADNLKNPSVFHTSIGFETALRKNLSFRADYIFQKGIDQFRSRNTNTPIADRRPNTDLGNIYQLESSGFFVRHSAKFELNGSLTKTVSFGINYTLAKKISDYDGIFDLPSDNYNLKSDRSAADDDQRHRFYANLIWRIRKGWRLSAIYAANSSLPYTITTGKDENGDTNFNDRPAGFLRNGERGKWRNQLDMGGSWFFSFIKRQGNFEGTTVVAVSSSEIGGGGDAADPKKRFSAKLFITARNVLNQTSFIQYSGVLTSPFFRRPISADNPRRVEFGLRFGF